MSHKKGLGSEHPRCDSGQLWFLVVYLAVWGLDSFVFRFSTFLADLFPLLVRLSLGILGILSLALGVYLIAKSEAAVFGRTNPPWKASFRTEGEPKLITTGVYAWVRHPMYLGSLLVLLLFFLATLSLLSLLVWAGLFVFYDRMAAYEEQDLYRILGQQYVNYQKQVHKWLLNIRRGDK